MRGTASFIILLDISKILSASWGEQGIAKIVMVDLNDPRAAAALCDRIGWANDRDRRAGRAIARRMDIVKIDAWRKCDHRDGLSQIDRL
jgi:hypothetical protein